MWEALVTPAAIKAYMLGATVTSDWVVGSPIVWTAEWQALAYEDKGICPNEDFDQIQPRDQVLGLIACSVDNVPATMRQPVLLSAQARRGFRLLL